MGNPSVLRQCVLQILGPECCVYELCAAALRAEAEQRANESGPVVAS